jgi:hypothetical protein
MTKQEFIDKKIAEFRKDYCDGTSGGDSYGGSYPTDPDWNICASPQDVEAFLEASLSEAMGEVEKETVICAAVRFGGKVWRGNRHPNAMEAMRDELSYTMNRKEMMEANIDREQGFITSRNRYVDRAEGLQIQLNAGIASVEPEGYKGQLYSEDLY